MAAYLRSLLICMIAVCSIPVASMAPVVTLFTPGIPASWGVVIYRIPAFVRTARGTLIAVAEARTTNEDCTYKFLAFRRSTDNGTTWSDVAELWGQSLKSPQGAGNPVLVFDSVTGRVNLHGSVNSPGHCNPTLWTFALDDGGSDGVTWNAPVNINHFLGKWAGATPGPGTATQVPIDAPVPFAGRLVVPAHFGAYNEVISWYSDDHGITWNVSETPLPGLDEVVVAALPNGQLLLNARTDHANASCDCRAVTRSNDGGTTWQLPVQFDPVLIEPVCQGSLVVIGPLSDSPSGSVFFANPASRTARVDLTVRRSDDGGNTWPHSLLLAPGNDDGLGYSCLAAGAPLITAEGIESGAILFEAPGGTIAFTTFPVVLPPTPPPPPPPTLIPATSAIWVGRHTNASVPLGAVSFDFPGVTATFYVRNASFFTGVFTSSCANGGTSRLEAGVDGDPLDTHSKDSFWVMAASPTAPYRISLASGLDPTLVHTLSIRNAVEARWAACAVNATLALGGIETDGVITSPPPPPFPTPRFLEFIGDSITAGFGTVPPCTSPSNAAREDASRGAALAVICRNLSADCSLVAVSGDTVIIPAGGIPASKPPIPMIYNRSLTYDSTALWDFNALASPAAVVINLGTNDVADSNFNTSYITALTNFLIDISTISSTSYYTRNPPLALVYCGPMNFTYCEPMKTAVNAAVMKGAKAVFLGSITATIDGCDGHPGVIGQKEMGEQLIPLIKTQMGW